MHAPTRFSLNGALAIFGALTIVVVAASCGAATSNLTGGDGGRIAAAHTADHLLTAASDDPCVVKEMQVTTYHVLWELVHVLFEQPGVLGPGVVR